MSQQSSGGFEFQLIESEAELATACGELAAYSWMAVDTEFERSSSYYPELCLIQLAVDRNVFVVDPMAIHDLRPLEALLFNEHITKVFHAARQDLEIFYHLYGRVPAPIFDTQVAGQLLGLEAQSSYAGLVKRLLDVELEKAHTRTDWKQRPLSPGQLRYAAEDVYYLVRLFETVKLRLTEAGMFAWLADDFAALVAPALYAADPYDCWKRIRPAKRLSVDELALLRHLAAWREITARNENLPRSWLLSDALLISLAKLRPRTLLELSGVQGLSKRFVARHGQTLVSIMLMALPPLDMEPEWLEQKQSLNAAQVQLVDKLYDFVQNKQKQYKLPENSLITRKGLDHLVRTGTHVQLQSGWRYHLVGRELLAMLNER